MKQIVGVDKNYNYLYEGDYVKTKYGRICQIEWKDTRAFKGYDLTPMLELDKPAPDEGDMWDPHNLEKTEVNAVDAFNAIFGGKLF
jgi:hypothetical protein